MTDGNWNRKRFPKERLLHYQLLVIENSDDLCTKLLTGYSQYAFHSRPKLPPFDCAFYLQAAPNEVYMFIPILSVYLSATCTVLHL